MVNEIIEILSKSAKEVIASPLSAKLLNVYSVLYLGGGQPRWCEKSQTMYYNQLAVDGLKKAKEMEQSGVLARTCELKKDLLIHVTALAMHLTHSNITDDIAIDGLTKGFLKEEQFIKLPESWIYKKDIAQNIARGNESQPVEKRKYNTRKQA